MKSFIADKQPHDTGRYAILCAFLSVLLTGTVLSVLFFSFDLYPFGGNTLSWGDMDQQVVPLLLEFKDILSGKASMFLNLQNAGGMSFWGIFFFFLSSPFSFLVIIIDKTDIYKLVNLLVAFKMMLSAGIAALFFSIKAENRKLLGICFSVSYAFCGFALLYYQNLLWLDLLYLFPLTMMGFQRIIAHQKPVMFCLCLIATITLSYYLSYMVLLFLLIASAVFCLFVVQGWDQKRAVATQIGSSALLAIGITAVIWIPSLLQYMDSARTQNILQTLSQSRMLTKIYTNLPIILCTGSVLAVPVLFCRRQKQKKQTALLVLLCMMLIPLIVEPINKMWHIGSYQAFPARYGYIPVFLGLWLLWELYSTDESGRLNSKNRYGVSLPILFSLLTILCGVIILRFYFDNITSYTSTLWINKENFLYLFPVFALSAISFILLLNIEGDKQLKNTAAGFTLILTLALSFFYSAVFIGSAANNPEGAIAYLSEASISSDDRLYRVKTGHSNYAVNMTGARGYATIDHYTSLTGKHFYTSMKQLGYSGYWMEISSYGGTVVSDMLLANEYTILENGEIMQSASNAGVGLVLPTGVLPEELNGESRLDIQDKLYEALTGKTGFEFYSPVRSSTEYHLKYEIEVTDEEILYFDIFKEVTTQLRENIYDSAKIYINGEIFEESYPSQKCNGILNLGVYENVQVIVEVDLLKVPVAEYITLAGFSTNQIESLYSSVESSSSSIQKNTITFTAQAEEGESLYLSLPRQEELYVYVNGNSVAVTNVLGCFYEIELYSGENQISITYIPQGIRSGVIVSCATLCVILLAVLLKKTGLYQLLKNLIGYCALPILILTAAAAFAAVYIAPMILSLFY